MNKKIFLAIAITFLLTGCYDKNELNKVSILTATEINKINDEYIVEAEVVNPQAPDKTITPTAPFIIYTGRGKTIQEAYRRIKLSSSRFLYSDQLQILLINENLAKEDITGIIDFYLRSPSSRSEFIVLVSQDDDILNSITPIDEISSMSISEAIKTNKQYLGVSNLTTFNDFINMLLNPRTDLILPSIKKPNISSTDNTLDSTENTEPDSMFEMGGLAVFKDNILKGYLTEEESITYNLIKNNIDNAIITYECEKNKYLSLEIVTSHSLVTTKNQKININIDIEGNLKELNCSIDLNKTKNIEVLESDLEKYLNTSITKDINNIRKTYNSDVFGFLDILYKYDYSNYQLLKNNWYESELKNISVSVKTNLSLTTTGNTMEVNYE